MQKVEQHINRLRAQIDDLRYRYHVLNDPQVTDKMYEGLVDELRNLESLHPELITPESPTQRVATEPSKKFQKVTHVAKQWSLKDAFTKQDLEDWKDRVEKLLEKDTGSVPKDLNYTCELKIDGLHIVLTYKKGILKTAATRGDGKIGEDVTANIKTIGSVPLRLKKDIDLIAEGEVWMASSMLKEINEKRTKNKEQIFANPRNAAAGTIRQLDPAIVAERKLSLTVYDISGGDMPESQEKELKDLKELGFLTDSHWKVCKNMDDVMAMYSEWKDKLKSNPYWVDGLVIKVNKKEYQDILGYTGKDPRWAIAMKFPAEQGTTKIKDIYVQVGRTGALTPVALMEPVQLAGTTVTHATLHNFDEIDRLSVRVGDTVVVEKAGDIIPKVVRVLEKMRTGKEKKYKAPKRCPICGSKVKRYEIEDKKNGGASLVCTNPKCYAQQLRSIGHFVSKKAFDIDGLGKKIVEQLVQEGLVKDVSDLFTLTKGDLEPLERFAEKSAENLIEAIDEAKDVTLARYIFGLGIRHVGEETAVALAQHFSSLEKLMKAHLQELEVIEDIGPRVAASIVEYFGDRGHQTLIGKLKKNGVHIKHQNIQILKHSKIADKTFVLTGTLESLTRDEAKERIRKAGGSVSGSVSKKTDYVVVGENPGSKAKQANELNVVVLNEKDFLEFLK